MIKNWRSAVSITLAIVLGSLLIYFGTDGFHAFTEESARTYQLHQEKPLFPRVMLEDNKERVYPFSEFEDKYVLITFFYTACTDVCPVLEMNFAEVYDQIPEKYIGEDIVFLSISFDTKHDKPAILENYRKSFGSDGETWRMARIPNQTELDNLLKKFGVIVIPDGNGHFQHNSAFYLVNKKGYLEKVMDYEKVDEAAHTVVSVLEKEAGE